MVESKEESILNAVSAMRNAWLETDELIDDLGRALLDVTEPIRFAEGDLINFDEDADVTAAFAWIFTARVHGIRGAPRKMGELTIVVDLGREGGIAVGLRQPIVGVVWGVRGDGWTDVFRDEGLSAIWPITHLFETQDRLVRWLGEPDDFEERKRNESAKLSDCAWYYLVPLFALSNASKIRDLIVLPVTALLGGVTQEVAFAGAPEIVTLST